MSKERIVIVGAGFAGLRVAKNLAARSQECTVTLIDKHNYHEFQPLMYQVATARMEPVNIAFPLRREFQGKRSVEIRLAFVHAVDAKNKIVQTSAGEIGYDSLVLCTGCVTNFYGKADIESNAIPMKSIPDAIALRNRLLQTFEDSLTAAEADKESLMNLVIAGGGPTGVELAGALAEMKKFVLPEDYPGRDFSDLNIILVDGGNNTLAKMSRASQQASEKYLEELGVRLMMNTQIESYDGQTVKLKDGKQLKTQNLIWTAGVTGRRLNGIGEPQLVKGNRIRVNRFFEVEGMQNIYAIGDIAYMETEKFPHGHPQLASVAQSQADRLSANFRLRFKQSPYLPFEYHDKGTMATIGKRKAVVDLPAFHFQGTFAWFTWMFVHLMLILGVSRKLKIFFGWAGNYFSNDSTLRVILKPDQ